MINLIVILIHKITKVEWLEPIFKNLAGYNCGGDLINNFREVMLKEDNE